MSFVVWYWLLFTGAFAVGATITFIVNFEEDSEGLIALGCVFVVVSLVFFGVFGAELSHWNTVVAEAKSINAKYDANIKPEELFHADWKYWNLLENRLKGTHD